MELADSITEIKTVCACGRKATVNARIDGTGRVITEGGQILLGGNDSYVAMCHKCWVDKIRAQKEAEKHEPPRQPHPDRLRRCVAAGHLGAIVCPPRTAAPRAAHC